MMLKILSKCPSAAREIPVDVAACAPQLHMAHDAFAYNRILFLPDTRDSYVWYIKNFIPYLHSWYDLSQSEYIYLENPVLFLRHPFDHNYSHFTLNCLHGYLLASDKNICHNEIKIAIPSYLNFQKQILKIADINLEQIINIESNILYKFKTVFYSDSLLGYSFNHPDYINLYERLAAKFVKKSNISMYITRKSNPKRSIINEIELIDFFKSKNFEIADFDELTVEDQMGLINRSKIICASHGASGANLIYRNKEKFKFVEIFSENRLTAFHAQILLGKNCDYTGIVNQATETLDKNLSFNDSSYIVDMDLLKSAFQLSSHTFSLGSSQPDSNNNVNSLITNVLKEYCPDVKNYMDALSLARMAEYGAAITNMEKWNYKKFNPCMREFYLNLLLLNGSYSKYREVFNWACENWQTESHNVLIDHSFKLANSPFFNEKPSFISQDNKILFAKYLTFKEKFLSISKNYPLTWHNSFLWIDLQSNKLRHSSTSSRTLICKLGVDGISLYDSSSKRYISSISSDSICSYSQEICYFPVIYHNEWNFSIIINNYYLSAHKNTFFTLAAKPREWERFFIPLKKSI